MSQEPIVSLEEVSFSYNGARILEDVTLSVRPNEFVCMVGPNGGGKTTLLKLLLGILIPNSGTVRIFGQPPEQARSRIGYMPQHVNYDPQFPVTVLDVVLMGRLDRSWFGRYSRADRKAAIDALEELEMEGMESSAFSSLSGGQRQRALIARALVSEPDLLLLDEPTANIDPVVEGRLFEVLQALNKRMTIVMVSHDLGFVSTVVKSVLCVNRRAVVHHTSELTGDTVREIYGGDLLMVRHDHRCAEEGHTHA